MKRLLFCLLPALLIACPDNSLDANAKVSLEPPVPTQVESADTLSFHATVTGSTRQGVSWSASAGSIDASGVFTPPDETVAVTVTVTSLANPQSQASATVNVTRSARITGSLYWDANANGTRNPDEPPLAGWQVYLDQNNNAALDDSEPRAYTDESGNYAFTRLHAGSYRVRHAGHLGYGSSLAVNAAAPVRPQIVGGSIAPAGKYPFTAALLFSNTSDPYLAQFCGGSLIAPQWVLTAAHCVTDNNQLMAAAALQVAVNIQRLENPLTRLNVTQIIRHPGYDPNAEDNDIALLHLAAPVKTRSVALLEPDQSALAIAGVNASIVGWGSLKNNGSFPTDFPVDLYAAQVPITGQATCAAAYQGGITDRMICAGLSQGGVDTCQGDSGGPLLVPAGPALLLAGATSFGQGCALFGVPGVYARVTAFSAWLETQVARGTGGVSGVLTLALGQQGAVSFAVQP